MNCNVSLSHESQWKKNCPHLGTFKIKKGHCEKLLPATGVIWALRAQSWDLSPKMSSRGLSAPRPKSSKMESKKSQNSWKNSLFWLFFDSIFDFLDPGAERPWELILGLFFHLWARRAQMIPVAGPRGLCFAGSVFDVSWAVGIARFESVSESPPNRTIQCY